MWLKNPIKQYLFFEKIQGILESIFFRKKMDLTQEMTSIFKDQTHFLSHTFFFAGKKKVIRSLGSFRKMNIFLWDFFKQYLLDLKTPFLGLPVTFRHPGERYQP